MFQLLSLTPTDALKHILVFLNEVLNRDKMFTWNNMTEMISDDLIVYYNVIEDMKLNRNFHYQY